MGKQTTKNQNQTAAGEPKPVTLLFNGTDWTGAYSCGHLGIDNWRSGEARAVSPGAASYLLDTFPKHFTVVARGITAPTLTQTAPAGDEKKDHGEDA